MVVNPMTVGAIGAALLLLLSSKKQTDGTAATRFGLTPEEFKAASRAQGERDRAAADARGKSGGLSWSSTH